MYILIKTSTDQKITYVYGVQYISKTILLVNFLTEVETMVFTDDVIGKNV